MFGAWTKIHVCQVVTWNMCYPVTCLCIFDFSCYSLRQTHFSWQGRFFHAKYIAGKPAKKLQYSQSGVTLIRSKDLYQTSLWHLNCFHLHLCILFFVCVCLQASAVAFFFFILNELPLCHPWACAGSVVTQSSLQKKPGMNHVLKPNNICHKDKSEWDVVLIKMNLCWHSLGSVPFAFLFLALI